MFATEVLTYGNNLVTHFKINAEVEQVHLIEKKMLAKIGNKNE